MYTTKNFKSKKLLKEAVAAGQKIGVYNPGLGQDAAPGAKVTLEGPHYPAPHTWYAQAVLDENCYIKSVK